MERGISIIRSTLAQRAIFRRIISTDQTMADGSPVDGSPRGGRTGSIRELRSRSSSPAPRESGSLSPARSRSPSSTARRRLRRHDSEKEMEDELRAISYARGAGKNFEKRKRKNSGELAFATSPKTSSPQILGAGGADEGFDPSELEWSSSEARAEGLASRVQVWLVSLVVVAAAAFVWLWWSQALQP